MYTAVMAKRWDFWVTPETDRLVRQAAATAERSLTEFVIGAAVLEAERLLADRTHLVLDAKEWSSFAELLDRAPRDSRGLERLFSKPSVFAAE
jgi:uncharacterized protein (DUF1778 family)